jgi:hypothetical protein
MRPLHVVMLLLALSPIALRAQQRDTGKPPTPVPTGTAEIAGVVVAPDGQPIGRAIVTLTGGVPQKSVLSDDMGAFAFQALQAGSYSVTARKASYIAAPYGTTRPGRAGTTIALAAGERSNIRLTMFKGAAVTGVIRDTAGVPVPGVDVRIIDVRTLSALDSSPVELATTDDRGVYRIYSLLPGEYVVVALPGAAGAEIASPSSMDFDATLGALAARDRAGTVAPSARSAVPPSTARPIGFAPIFYPGTPNYLDAAHVRVAPGEERAGIDFELKPVPVASIDAVVIPSLLGVQVTLFPMGPRFVTSFSSAGLSGKAIDTEGKFRYSNLAPGRYRIVARVRQGGGDAAGPTVANGVGVQGGGGRGGGPPVAGAPATPASGNYLYAYADVDVRGDDVANVSLTLQDGGVITGRIVFNGTTGVKPADLTAIRPYVSVEGGGWSMGNGSGLTMGPSLTSQAITSIKPDGTFEIRGIGPGRFTLGFSLPADAKGWSLISAAATDRDLLDDAIEIVPGREIRDVTVLYSDSPAELSGTLQSASGQPTTEYHIVLLPEDRTLWRVGSRRIKSARPSTAGRFQFANVPAGSYVVAALSDLDPLDLLDMTFLEQIAPAGVKVSVTDGEKKVQDLRIR